MCTECRIFFSKLCQSFTHLTLIILCLWLDSKLNNWLREFHRLKDYWMLLVTDCITGCCNLESNCCSDITRVNLVDLCTGICMHLNDTSYTLLLTLCCVQYIRT